MRLMELLIEREVSYDDMVNKLQSVYILMARGGTPGEKSAASAAYKRLLAAIRRDFGDDNAASAEARVKGKGQSGATSGSSRYQRKPKENPYKSREKKKENPYTARNRGYGGEQSHIYTDPRTDWTFYVLRFTDPNAGKRGSDKVWGYATRDGEFMSFWGAYGKTVKTKVLKSDREALKLFDTKINKGYKYTNVSANPADYAFIFSQFS